MAAICRLLGVYLYRHGDTWSEWQSPEGDDLDETNVTITETEGGIDKRNR
jgi:hypothetical protein